MILEAAITTILDFEDSVAAVDADDKVLVYRNWLGLMKGDLAATFEKGGKTVHPRAEPRPHLHRRRDGGELTLPGRSLMLVRNVGHHMTTDAVARRRRRTRSPKASSTPLVTSLIAHARPQAARRRRCATAATGSVYIVKPKMHGPEEVAFADELFGRVEDAARPAAQHAEDRHHGRGAAHHASTSRPASRRPRDRVVFINTGFLDRTGDEIHTSMEAGADDPQGRHEGRAWIKAYEDSNVDVGLACGLRGQARRSARACGRCPT